MKWKAYARWGDFTFVEIAWTSADGLRLTVMNRQTHLSLWRDIEAFEETADGETVFVRIQGHKLLNRKRHVVYHSS